MDKVNKVWLNTLISNRQLVFNKLVGHLYPQNLMVKNKPFSIKLQIWERTGASLSPISRSKSKDFTTRWLTTQPGIIKWVRGVRTNFKVIRSTSVPYGRMDKLKASLNNSYDVQIYPWSLLYILWRALKIFFTYDIHTYL